MRDEATVLNVYIFQILCPLGRRSRDGAVVRALASHQYVPSSIPGTGVICGLSVLSVLYSSPRGFAPGTPVFPSPQRPTFPNLNSIPEYTDIAERVLVSSLVLRE